MDDNVARGESGPTVAIQAESVDGDVAGHRLDPSGGHLGEAIGTEGIA